MTPRVGVVALWCALCILSVVIRLRIVVFVLDVTTRFRVFLLINRVVAVLVVTTRAT